jgi:hypothetical protein
MELRRLDEVITFTLGKNPTRMREESTVYSLEDFESDLHCEQQQGDAAQCILNLIKSKVAPVSVQNANKCITSNFLYCNFDEQILDRWYFCYQFNEGKELEQQIAMFHQGTTLCVKKLNVKTIGELQIKLPDIETQRKIGRLYKQSLIQQRLLRKQAEEIQTFTRTIIENITEE